MRPSAILRAATQRPWAVPRQPWLMRQTWDSLLFAHWPVAASALTPLLPPGLALDTWEGAAWIGIVPFQMRDVRPHGLPPIPGTAAFPELNLRTYVSAGGKPGVWFFSLDAASPLAVTAARVTFHLPYHAARMRLTLVGAARPPGECVAFASDRLRDGACPAAFHARYGPTGEAVAPRAGTIEHFLTERYCLYTTGGRGALLRADITHAPWQLHSAEAEIAANTVAAAAGIALPASAPLLHYAAHQEALAWAPRRVQ